MRILTPCLCKIYFLSFLCNYLAIWIDDADPSGGLVRVLLEQQDVLVHQHTDGDTGHVEAIQEILKKEKQLENIAK